MTPRARILTVYGTRPEAIKVAPVIKALEKRPQIESITLVTGQHREMLDQVNSIFGIVPDHDLDVFAHGQGLNVLIAKVIERLDPVLETLAPDALVVQGDTSTVAAASLAAFNRQVPVVHVEAGLRSGDIMSPFPEEANRKITTQVARLHLAPTPTSKANLLRESVPEDTITVTGNTVTDALFHTVAQDVPLSDARLEAVVQTGQPILLVTSHRRENWDGAMERVGRAVSRLARRYQELQVVLPAHRNPIVREALLPQLQGLNNVFVTEPMVYGEFTRIMSACAVVLTDSGGVQEEAPSLGKPVLVMRENTERPEAVHAGTVRLVGTNEDRIVREVSNLLDDETSYAAMANAVNPYGDGRAAARSVAAIENLLFGTPRLPDFGG